MSDHDSSHMPLKACPLGDNCPNANEVTLLRGEVEHLLEQTRTDTLTGLANYRSFSAALDHELERTQRSGQPTALIMIDIDHFKKVNDTLGHEVGNRALIHIANIIEQSVRKLDIACRYGGEEFAVILPDTGLHAARQVAERIRASIETSPLDVDHDTLRPTASLGIATYRLDHQPTAEALVEEADSFLYQAKQGGRNRVCHADLPPVHSVSSEEKDVLSSLFGAAPKNRKNS